MEQKPNKKEELMLANNVLKLAADLLKVKEIQIFLDFEDTFFCLLISMKLFFYAGIGKPF